MASEPIRIPIRSVQKEIINVGGDDYILIDDGVSMGRAKASNAVDVRAGAVADAKIAALNLGSASRSVVEDFATAAQGSLADTAVQPGDVGTMAAESASDYTPTAGLAAVSLSNDYVDLDNLPTLGTMAAEDAGEYTKSADLGDLATKNKVEIPDIDATGTPSGTTYLRGDGSWQTPAGGGGSSSDDIDNDSGVPGGTVTEALDALDEKTGEVLIFRTVVETANNAFISFEDIPQGFDRLVVRFKVKGVSTNDDILRMRFNDAGPSGTENWRQAMWATTTTVTASRTDNISNVIVSEFVPNAARSWCIGDLVFPGYAVPTGGVVYYGFGGSHRGFRQQSGTNNIDAPLTELHFWLGAADPSNSGDRNNWGAGSTIEVFGVKHGTSVSNFWAA